MFRRRATKTVPSASSSPRCVMCGVEVTVDYNGFCPLGHYVGATQVPVDVFPEPARRAEPEPGAVFTEPTIPMSAFDRPEPSAGAPDAEVTAEVPIYTGVLLDEPAPAFAAPADEPSQAQHALDELLAFGSVFTAQEQSFSALDVPADDFAVADSADEPAFAAEAIAAPDDEEDEVLAARRRAAGLLGGSVLTLAMLAGSVALLPL